MQQLTFYKAYKVIFVVVVVVVVVVCVCKRVLQTYHMLISSFYLVDRVEIFFIQWSQKDKILIVFNMMQDFYVLSIKINHRTYEESLLYLVYTRTSKIWVLSYFSYGFQWLKPKLPQTRELPVIRSKSMKFRIWLKTTIAPQLIVVFLCRTRR